jgi:hypothetical protein
MASPSSLKCSYEDSKDSKIDVTNDDEHSGLETRQANGLETRQDSGSKTRQGDGVEK